ncbi:3-methyl-2-oxobutanoate hydroxymethyltransferase [Acetivibrio clariflavus]|uniref:3-methyl-2-oxobutanoate hydroxymethyltransferase n=1 Tax=Acetivibrio clariflavus (strain DSM 19732 / NBRC 101661 / EBR45) TaxID=720554 RepID=G8LWQ2_ACECE|nr:3-methyl-2-oxobutanoate hydroxymethyltransferase [Acetivibrio clariflavus]AEV68720.1 ketopantoate hydroxymethyltransferase [Acetivibrio clariflavus DSM 19732]
MSEKITVSNFRESKRTGRKITMLTAYDYPTAKIIDQSGIDAILVGDSLGMVVLGYEDTTRVTMEDMVHHTKAVVRGAKRAMVVADMPFLSYHMGIYESVRNAGRLVNEAGCKAIKLEGGEEVVEDIKAIIRAGIPVMGHLGYTPQSINVFGGHKAQGKTFETAKKIYRDALLLQEAGVFAIVLECVPYKLAQFITEKLEVPTIGIGSGAMCDGQVLVIHDIIGMFRDFIPRHTKRYSDVGEVLENSVKSYIKDVTEGVFPTEKNSFTVEDEVIEALEKIKL